MLDDLDIAIIKGQRKTGLAGYAWLGQKHINKEGIKLIPMNKI